jgi:hypothetical protein
MPKQKKTWILAKGCEYRPGGTISLGQILVKPFEPSLPLLPDGPLPLPESGVERSYQSSVEAASYTALGGSFKIWADVSMLPIGGDLGGKFLNLKNVSWHFDRLETEIMVPRLLDVQTAISKEEVVAQINRKKFDFKRRLYMVTGVRIARGARLFQSDSRMVGGKVAASADLSVFSAVPLKSGSAVDFSSTKIANYSFNDASDFIYAYRVCEIHYGKDVYTKPFNKGDTFGLDHGGDDESSDEDDEGGEERIVVEKIEDSEYTGSEVPHQSFDLKLSEETDQEELIVSDA